jgi:hypothetical protein
MKVCKAYLSLPQEFISLGKHAQYPIISVFSWIKERNSQAFR